MAFGDIVQSKVATSSDAVLTTLGATFDSTPASGNLIFFAVAPDKDAVAITQPAGFTEIEEIIGLSISAQTSYKISDGTETGLISASWTGVVSKPALIMMEIEGPFTGSILDEFISANSGESTVTSQSTGTTGTLSTTPTIALAFMATDSATGTADPRSWTNGFGNIITADDDTGTASCFTGTALLGVTTAVETTGTYTGSPDQSLAMLAVFNSGGPAPAIGTDHVLSGAITNVAATIKGTLAGSSANVKLEYDTDAGFGTSVTTSATATVSPDNTFSFSIAALATDQKYFYRILENDLVSANGAGEFATWSINTPLNFTFVLTADDELPSISPTHAEMLTEDPLFWLSTGDTPYIDDETVSGLPQRIDYLSWLDSAPVKTIHSKVPYAYVWDDHDYGNNNSDSTNPGKSAQQTTYREFFPSYALSAVNQSIYQSFVVGRVMFIVLDLRSERLGVNFIDAVQKTWFDGEVDTAQAAPGIGAIAVVSSVPWHTGGSTDLDTWAGATVQRTAIADKLVSSGFADSAFFLCGDAHMLAVAFGTTQYDTGSVSSFRTFVGAPANRASSVKGDGWDIGPFSDSVNQYMKFVITDDGVNINIASEGFSLLGPTWTSRFTNNYDIAAPLVGVVPVLMTAYRKRRSCF